MPLVSVVTALYNHKPFLAERVRSILGQTLRDFEWIVVDDCSTDGSYDEIQRLTAADTRVRVLRNERNRGHMVTNQRGLDEARGTYVYRVDSDDSCDGRFLEAMTRLLAAHTDAGLAYCRSLRMDARNGVWGGFPRRPGRYWRAPEAFSELALNYTIRAPSILFRRDKLEEVGGFDCRPSGMTSEWHADWHLSLRLALSSGLVFHPEALAYHRTHGTNLSRDAELMLNNFALLEDVFDRLPPSCAHLAAFRAGAYRNVANGIHSATQSFPAEGLHAELQRASALIARYVPGFVPEEPSRLRRLADTAALAAVKRLTYRRLQAG
ncbi:MAG TPA: glycosyltransferase family 2 protein [Stellaceae bacterium]|nr:glycosyltransferase family 2 protein [Stellaceae bacterium]